MASHLEQLHPATERRCQLANGGASGVLYRHDNQQVISVCDKADVDKWEAHEVLLCVPHPHLHPIDGYLQSHRVLGLVLPCWLLGNRQ